MAIKLTKDNNFDFLRFLAAAMVLFSHCFPLYGIGWEPLAKYTQFDTFGGLAVSIFFTLSGFLITASWTKNPKLIPYFKNRVLRIFPAYYVVTILAVVFMGLFVTTLPLGEYFRHPLTYKYFLNFSLYFQHHQLPGVFEDNIRHGVNGPIWTLPKEFTMYILIAALGLCQLLRGRMLIALYLLSFAGYIGYTQTHLQDKDAWIRISIVKNAVFFLSGALFWHYRERITLSPKLCILLLVILALAAGHAPYSRYVFMLCLPYLVLVAGLWPTKHLRNFGQYGDFSYGFYLYAFPVQQCYMHWVGNAWGFWSFVWVSMAITLGCAIASWHLVERPCLRLKSFTIKQRIKKVST